MEHIEHFDNEPQMVDEEDVDVIGNLPSEDKPLTDEEIENSLEDLDIAGAGATPLVGEIKNDKPPQDDLTVFQDELIRQQIKKEEDRLGQEEPMDKAA